ncbi:MAG: hypothetical protein ACI8R4_002881 [Paracoccaceae bacterium]|jgi:hypothetical protein
MEDMGSFYKALSSRLGFARDEAAPWENRQSTDPDPLMQDAQARALCQQVYASDYEAFSY